MRARIIIIAVGSLCLLLSQWAQAELYNDGGVHDVVGEHWSWIEVDNPSPPPPAYTTVIFSGTGGSLTAYNSSQVIVNGGTFMGWLEARDNSQVIVDHSSALGDVRAYNNSQVTINDGPAESLYVYDNSRVTVNGGHITWHVEIGGNSQVTINGGRIDEGLYAGDNSRVTLNGIEVGPWAILSGNITVVGSDFSVYRDWNRTDLVFSGFGDLDSLAFECFLWGTLKSGDLLEGVLLRVGHFSFVPVPLPGAVLLGMIGLSVAGWRLRRSIR